MRHVSGLGKLFEGTLSQTQTQPWKLKENKEQCIFLILVFLFFNKCSMIT